MYRNQKNAGQPHDVRNRAPQFSRKFTIKKQLCQGRAAKFAIWVKSALRELRCTTGSLQTVLLTFLHTRIAGQEAFLLQSSTVLLVLLQQSAAQAVADSASLALISSA